MFGNIKPLAASMLADFLPILEQTSDGIQIFDTQGYLVYVNEAAADSFGFSAPEDYLAAHRQQFCGLEMLSFRDAAGTPLEPTACPCVQALQGRAVAEMTLFYTDQQQRDRCLAMRASPLRDDTGSVQYGVVLSRDLTDQHQTHRAVEQATQQLHQMADAVPSWVAHLDPQEQHVFANSAYLKAFQVTADIVQGQPLQSVVGPVLYQQLHRVLKQAFQGKAAKLCLPISGLKPRLQHKQVSVIPQQQGAVVTGVCLIISDIAAHQHTTELLQTESDFFRYSLEAAAVGTWEWQFESNEMTWSSPQERLFGLAPGSFDGNPKTFLDLVDDRDRANLDKAIHQAQQPPQLFAAEFRITSVAGPTRWLLQRGQVLCDAVGKTMRMVGVTFDVTEQRVAQEQLLLQMHRDRLLANISQLINRSERLTDVLPTVVETVREHLDVDRLVMIDLREQAGKVISEAHIPDLESMKEWQMRHPWSVKSSYLEKFRLGHPVAVGNIYRQAFSESELNFLDFFGINADLSIPLLEEKQLWALLSAQSHQPREWQPEEQRLLETIGTIVSSALQRERLHHNLTRANRKLQRFAYLDGLTRVANRRRFEQFLSQEWRRLSREQAEVALIMADIDYFKAYNDIYGHQAGDDCLRRVASILRSAIKRPADMVARYGGEEFVVVLPKTNVEGAETVAEQIRSMVHQAQIPHQGSQVSKFVTMSLGVAVMLPHPLKRLEDLVKFADEALYQAKADGRDRVVISSP
ncbi:MAG: diguanylate cyclase [Leptolyngbyaceae cyanobacterium]